MFRRFHIEVCHVLAGVCLLGMANSAQAILFDATGEPGHNTNAPTGALAGSGWTFEGEFSDFLGTAVAPHFFLTATHIGGTTNTPFVMDGVNYFPDAHYDDPGLGSDLRLWHVPERLPRYAPTYTGIGEPGLPIITIGRGTQRGEPVITDGLTNGWHWGTSDHLMRWGSNSVSRVVTDGDANYLYATFDHGAGPDECHLSIGDSGGSAFVFADGRWQLAGILYGVDASFSETNSGGFSAAITDMAGLYFGSDSNWTLITNHIASGFYASRVSNRYAWLTNVIPDFDSDANGLPDRWEQTYFGAIQGATATNDPDADGADNLSEWVAHTDPTNSKSRLTISAIQRTLTATTLTFDGSQDRFYRIYAAESLPTNAWTLLTSNSFTGANGPTLWSDTNITSVANRFYRIRASLDNLAP